MEWWIIWSLVIGCYVLFIVSIVESMTVWDIERSWFVTFIGLRGLICAGAGYYLSRML